MTKQTTCSLCGLTEEQDRGRTANHICNFGNWDLKLCKICGCMTKTIKGYCGKCNFKKDAMAKNQKLIDPECLNCNQWLGKEYQYCPSCGGGIIWDREHTKVLEVLE